LLPPVPGHIAGGKKTHLGWEEKAVLVGGLEHEWIMTFHSVGNFMTPTDELIFFRGLQTTIQCSSLM
jgi:hypothetical protein